MRCCVPFCKTTAEIVSECENIAFHEFPNEAPVRAAWLRALGKQDTLLPDPAVVCSQHFLSDDIYETESGSRRIRTGAIPSTVQVCMICFDTHSKLFPMSKYKLEEAYKRLVGHPVCDQGNLRQAVCVQCAQRLVNFSKFRDKSLRACALMMELVGKHELITIRHVKSISRAKHQLQSGIVKTVLEPDRCDVHVAHCDAGRPTAPSVPAVSVDSAITAANSADNSTDSFNEHLRAYNEGYFDDSVAVKSEDCEPAQPPTQCESSALCCEDDDGSHVGKQKSSEHCDQALVAAMAASPGTRLDAEQRPTEEADTTGTFAPSGVATNDESKEHPTDTNDELDILCFVPNRIVVEDARNPQDTGLKPEELLPETTGNSISCRTTRRSELRTNQRMDTDYSEIKSEISQNSILDTQLAKPEDRIQYICDVCQKIFQRKPVLVIHMRTHTGEKPFACKLCDYKCTQKGSLVRHTRTHTGEKPFACKLCDYKCAVNSDLVNHMRNHTGEKPFACKLCDYKCKRNSHLVTHMRTHTGEKPFACKLCNYKCTVNSSLVVHMRTHTGERPFACKSCNYKCTQSDTLLTHMRTHTGEKSFACKLCDFKSARKTHLVTHMRTHTGEKPFACKLCDYKCSQKSNLVNHMRNHTGEKPFACKLCDYKCKKNIYLVTHMRTHTGERPFACKLCDYKCSQKSNLVSHMRTHTGERPFVCKLCNYKCTKNSSLVSHMRIHTGERPFACKLCNYKGTENSSLVNHMRTHTGERPFACKLCNYKCTKNSSLVRHMRTHTGERLFACKLCNYKGTVNSSLVTHMRTHTGEKP